MKVQVQALIITCTICVVIISFLIRYSLAITIPPGGLQNIWSGIISSESIAGEVIIQSIAVNKNDSMIYGCGKFTSELLLIQTDSFTNSEPGSGVSNQ